MKVGYMMPIKDYVNELEGTMEVASSKPKQEHYVSGVSAIDGMDGHEFERFCADLLRKVGFSEVTVTPGSGDQGVDVLATKDGIKYAIQCKNYSSALGNTPVQEVTAGKQFYGCHVGVVMTNSTFTPGAIQLATATNVLLWDRRKLDELISKAGGYRNLGICTDYDSSDIDDELDESYDDYYNADMNSIAVTKTNRPRKGLRIWSIICIGWSVISLLMLLLERTSSDGEDAAYEGMFLGEGIFALILGLMFGTLSKTEKGNPYMDLGGKRIKKWVFVILCIIIAYVLLIGVAVVTG